MAPTRSAMAPNRSNLKVQNLSAPGASPRGGASPRVSGSLPSGIWKGTITENGKNRPAVRRLCFQNNGMLLGNSDADMCTLEGAFRMENPPTVTWTEKYEWGTLQVSGRYQPLFIPPKIVAS